MVLVVGVLGVFALVPTSVQTAGETVDQLTLAERAESILQPVRLGARDAREVWGPDPVTGRRARRHAFILLPLPAALPVVQPLPVETAP